MKFLNILKLISSLWPVIQSIVYQIEASFPDAGLGKVKLTEVLNLLREGWDVADIKFDDAVRLLTSAISTIVKLANITGRFKSGAEKVTE